MTDTEDPEKHDRTQVLTTLERLELWDREGLAPTGFAVTLLLATAALLYTLAPFITDIILAFVIVGMFNPIYRKLQNRLGRRWLCSGIVTCLAIVVVAAPIVWLAIALFEEASNAYERLMPALVDGSAQQVVRSALAQLGFKVSQAELLLYVESYAERLSDVAIAEGGKLVNNLVSALLHFCVIFVLVFYTLVEGPKLKEFLFKLSPLPDEQDALIVAKFMLVARSVLIGNGIGSILQGVVGAIAIMLVGLPSPVLWGTVMSIAAFLPFVGISLVVLPAGFYLILQGQTAEGVAFMSICLSVALVIENVFKTKLMGFGVRVHEVLLFLGILGGLAGFGLIGLLYGPLIVAIFLTLTDLYMSHYRPHFAARYAQRKRARGSLF